MRQTTPSVVDVPAIAGVPTSMSEDGEVLEERLRTAEAEIAVLLAHTSDLACVADAAGRVVYANHAWREALGYEAGLPVALNLADLLVEESRGAYRAACRLLLDGSATAPLEARLRATDGRQCEVQGTLAARVAADGTVAMRGLFRNMSARLQQDARLTYATTHDRLTGLANRAQLLQALPQALARAARAGRTVGVVYLDLDDFRGLNARFGYARADQALVTVADHLRRCVRAGDIAARLEGDAFAVMVENVNHPDDIRRVAERVLDAIASPLIIDGEWALLRGSVGGAIGDAPSADAEDLLLAAESAMREAEVASLLQTAYR